MMDGMGKRKIVDKKKIILFINSLSGERCGAIFEVYIKLHRSFTYSSNSRSRQVSYYVESDYPEGDNTIYPIRTFFDQRPENRIRSVGACLLGSELFMVPYDEPDEEPEDMAFYEDLELPLPVISEKLTPLIFNFNDSSIKSLPELNARKVYPVVAAIGTANKVFSLTSYVHPCLLMPEPCFESLDLNNFNYNNNNKLCWRPLPCYRLHEQSRVTGYAVLAEDFILISLKTSDKVVFRSYNIWSSVWKDVLLPHPTQQQPCFYDKEGVVVGNDIYTYQHNLMKLFVFSFTDLKRSASGKNYDLSLSSPCAVKGLEFEEKDDFGYAEFYRSSAIAKLDDGILCILHTLCPLREFSDVRVLHVRVWLVLLQERELCTTLKSFECTLSTGMELMSPKIKSCHVLNLKEESDRRGGKRAVRSNNADDKVLEMEMDCGGT